jgi:hypothetical protein
MSSTMQVSTAAPMTVASIRERSQHVQALIKDLMVEDVHYMTIPGTRNKSLTKQGSEMLLSAFHVSVEPHVEDKSDPDAVRFTVRAVGTHMGTGIIVGVGIGRCSSNEEKYKWRQAVCEAEWTNTPVERRRVKYGLKQGGNGFYTVQQIRTNPEDVANTILKMAKKRAQADLCLTALAASDAFRPQPRPENTRSGAQGDPKTSRAAPGASNTVSQNEQQAKPAGTGPSGQTAQDTPRPATSAQLGLLKKKLDDSGIPETAFLAQFELGHMEEIPFTQVDAALAWIRSYDP